MSASLQELPTFVHVFGQIIRHFFRDPVWLSSFSRLNEFGLSFDLQCNPQQMSEFCVMLRNMPGGPPCIILDHLGLPQLGGLQDEKTHQLWREGLQELARFPNTFVKLSMLTHAFASTSGAHKWWCSREGTDFVRHRLVEEAIAVFGSHRCMFATNWPVDAVLMKPRETMQFFLESSESYDVDSRRNLFSGACRQAYRIPPK